MNVSYFLNQKNALLFLLFLARAHFGPAPGDILLDDMRCVGTEQELIECSHSGILNHNCDHQEDAGVSCTSEWSFPSCNENQLTVYILCTTLAALL